MGVPPARPRNHAAAAAEEISRWTVGGTALLVVEAENLAPVEAEAVVEAEHARRRLHERRDLHLRGLGGAAEGGEEVAADAAVALIGVDEELLDEEHLLVGALVGVAEDRADDPLPIDGHEARLRLE